MAGHCRGLRSTISRQNSVWTCGQQERTLESVSFRGQQRWGVGQGRGGFSLVWPRTGSRGGRGVSKQDAAAAAQEGPCSKLSGLGSPTLTEGGEIRTSVQLTHCSRSHQSKLTALKVRMWRLLNNSQHLSDLTCPADVVNVQLHHHLLQN